MLHLVLIIPDDLALPVRARLEVTIGVAHVIEFPGTVSDPPGVVVTCDVVRESANELIEWLQDQGVHRRGAIAVHDLETVISDAAEDAERRAPGHGADSLVWEEVEAGAREDGTLTASFLVFMVVASIIAAIGLLLDTTVLIVGAMVIGPEYGPLSAICVAAARRRVQLGRTALATFVAGMGVAVLAAFLATAAARLLALAPPPEEFSQRTLTAFISRPDGLGAAVAVLAGVAGMLSLTQSRANALVGVLVSVTTIPAAADIGAAAAYGAGGEAVGGLIQLGINVVGLILAGMVTLLVQAWATRSRVSGDQGRAVTSASS